MPIKLDKEIREKAPANPFKNFSFLSMTSDEPLGLNDILDNIHRASTDPKIRCVLLNVGYIQASYETIEEIWPDYPTDEDYLWNEDEY